MNTQLMDKLQWAFDLVYGLIPRSLSPNAIEPLLVGHRGVFQHPELLENTFPAFDLALAHGGGIEFDLHLTRDDVVVVHHDATLQRVHGAPHSIRELGLQQLQDIAPAVPTLDELFARYGHRCPHYFMEPKVRDIKRIDTLVESVGQSLERTRLAQSATVISSDPHLLDRVRCHLPDQAKAFIFMVNNRNAVNYVKQHGDTGLAGWYFAFPESVRPFLEERGLHQGVGHIDYGNTHRHYANRGFRYQFTNRIDRLVKPIEGLTLPQPIYGLDFATASPSGAPG